MGRKSQSPIFEKKSSFAPNCPNMPKNEFFSIFLENGSKDFSENMPDCSTNHYLTARENRMSKNIWFLRYRRKRVFWACPAGQILPKKSLFRIYPKNGSKNFSDFLHGVRH